MNLLWTVIILACAVAVAVGVAYLDTTAPGARHQQEGGRRLEHDS